MAFWPFLSASNTNQPEVTIHPSPLIPSPMDKIAMCEEMYPQMGMTVCKSHRKHWQMTFGTCPYSQGGESLLDFVAYFYSR
jgi:hypothetical protein